MAGPSSRAASLPRPPGRWNWPDIPAGVPGAAQRTGSACTELQSWAATHPRRVSQGPLGGNKVFCQNRSCSYRSCRKTKAESQRLRFLKGRGYVGEGEPSQTQKEKPLPTKTVLTHSRGSMCVCLQRRKNCSSPRAQKQMDLCWDFSFTTS